MSKSNVRSKSPIFGNNQDNHINSRSVPVKLNPSFQFSNETTPKVNCHYHPQMRITNFCMKPECLMPLCAACVEVHQDEHSSKQTIGKFELLENSLTYAYKNIISECNLFVDDNNEVNKFLSELQNRNQIFKNQINEAKQKILQTIESFFENLEKTITKSQEQNIEEIQKEVISIQQSTQKRWETLVSIQEKLNTENCLKSLIKFHSRNILSQCKNHHHDIQANLLEQRAQVAQLTVNQSVVTEINLLLQKFVKFNLPESNPRQVSPYQIKQDPPKVLNILSNKQNLPPPQYLTLAQQQFQQQQLHQQQLHQQQQQLVQFTPTKFGMGSQIPQYQTGQVIPINQINQMNQIQHMNLINSIQLKNRQNAQTIRTPSPGWDQIKYSPKIDLS